MTMDTLTSSNGQLVELDKVIALFTGPNSADLYERHIAAIYRLCRNNVNGFAIRDLPKVQQVLELSVALLKRLGAIFLDPICELVSLLAKPFIRRTATDEFKMLNHITNILSAVGSILRSAGLPAQVYAVTAQMITTFANAYGNRPNVLDLTQQQAESEGSQRQYHTNQSLLNKSGVIADVISALARVLLLDPDSTAASDVSARALAVPLTVALLALSYNADNCTSMVEAGALQCLPALLARGPHAETTCTAVELTWNIVEYAPSARTMLSRPLPSLEALARGGGLASTSGETTAGRAGPGGGEAAGLGPGTTRASGTGAAISGAGAEPYDRVNGSSAGGLESGSTLDVASLRASLATMGLGDGGGGGGGGGSRSLGPGLQPADPAFKDPNSNPGADNDGEWQGPDGGGGDGRELVSSLSLHGANGYEEFGETPDLRIAEDPSRGATAGGDDGASSVAASTTAAAATGVAADAPVVQTLADALVGLLRALLLRGFSKADKELRNDVIVALNLMLEAPDFRAAAAFTGAFDSLLAAATCPELATRPDLVANYALTTDSLDHELRLLVWSSLQLGCQLPEILDAVVAGGFMRVLLLYVTCGESHPAVRRWNPDQLATLRAAALSKLHALAPMCPGEYERAGGPGTLLGFMSASVGPAHLEAALRHLHRLFVLVPETRDGFGATGLIPLLLGLVGEHVGSGSGGSALGHTGGSRLGSAGGLGSSGGAVSGGGQGQPEAVRHFALLCLTALCTVHAENQRQLRKAGGVGVLLAALARLRGLDPLLPAPYAVAVLDCIWAAVVPDRKSTARFLVDHGMDLLLNHLECGNKGHRPVALRVLSDLLENPRSHPFFHDWQSDVNKQTAAHMLLSIWMEEDTLRGMTGPDGLLANPGRPLAGLEKRTKWVPAENVAYGNMSPAKKETVALMMDNLNGETVLAKIYGVFKLVGFDSCPYLDQRDHAVLAAVEKYAKFRQGDVWRSIQADFDASDLRPTAPDRIRLESGIELSESLAVAVRETQARLLGRAQDTLKAAETRLFEGMRSQTKLEAEYRFIQLQERTPLTLAEMRRAKEQKATMLKNSLQSFQFQQGGEE